MSEGFDTRVHHRDPKTGRVVRATPYKRHCSKDEGTWYIRDGVHYYENGAVKYDPKAQAAAEVKVASEEIVKKEDPAQAPQKAKSEKKGQ